MVKFYEDAARKVVQDNPQYGRLNDNGTWTPPSGGVDLSEDTHDPKKWQGWCRHAADTRAPRRLVQAQTNHYFAQHHWPIQKKTQLLNYDTVEKDGAFNALEDVSDAPAPEVEVVERDCLDVAEDVYKRFKVPPVVLNMANQTHAGGDYAGGSGAQEEDLFRRTNLGPALVYAQHETHAYKAGSDNGFQKGPPEEVRLGEFNSLFTPNLKIVRKGDDKGYAFLPKNQHTPIHVVSSAAYDLHKSYKDDGRAVDPGKGEGGKPHSDINPEYYREGMKKKIRSMLYAAQINGTKTDDGKVPLVLSAFGCGAFGNDPKVVAGIFKAVLSETQFQGAFEVVFAIKPNLSKNVKQAQGADGKLHDPNFIAFEKTLTTLSKRAKSSREEASEIKAEYDNHLSDHQPQIFYTRDTGSQHISRGLISWNVTTQCDYKNNGFGEMNESSEEYEARLDTIVQRAAEMTDDTGAGFFVFQEVPHSEKSAGEKFEAALHNQLGKPWKFFSRDLSPTPSHGPRTRLLLAFDTRKFMMIAHSNMPADKKDPTGQTYWEKVQQEFTNDQPSPQERRSIYGVFQDKKTGKKVLVFNLHLDPKYSRSDMGPQLQAMRKIQLQYKVDEVYMLGDYNVDLKTQNLKWYQDHYGWKVQHGGNGYMGYDYRTNEHKPPVPLDGALSSRPLHARKLTNYNHHEPLSKDTRIREVKINRRAATLSPPGKASNVRRSGNKLHSAAAQKRKDEDVKGG